MPNRSRIGFGIAAPSMPSGTRTAVTTFAFSSSGPNSSRPMPFTASRAARPSTAWRSNTPGSVSCSIMLERHVERPDERDRRREGAVGRVLALALAASAPSRSSSCGRRARARRRRPRARAPRPTRTPGPGGAHQRLLRAGDDHVDAPFVGRQVDDSEARRRRRSTITAPCSVRDLGEGADVVHDAGRGLRLRREHRLDLSAGARPAPARPRPGRSFSPHSTSRCSVSAP